MEFNRCARKLLFRLIDALVLLFVFKNAAWSAVLHRYGASPDWASTIAWFVLSMGYLALATAASPSPVAATRSAPRVFKTAAAGALSSLLAFTLDRSLVAAPALVERDDWVVLTLAYACCALVARTVPTYHEPRIEPHLTTKSVT